MTPHVTPEIVELVRRVQRFHNDNMEGGTPHGEWHVECNPELAAGLVAVFVRDEVARETARLVEEAKRSDEILRFNSQQSERALDAANAYVTELRAWNQQRAGEFAATEQRLATDAALLTERLQQTPHIDECDRQTVVLALAQLTFPRPGWAVMLRAIAVDLKGELMFDDFVRHGPDAVRAPELPELVVMREAQAERDAIAIVLRKEFQAGVDTWDETDLLANFVCFFNHHAEVEAERNRLRVHVKTLREAAQREIDYQLRGDSLLRRLLERAIDSGERVEFDVGRSERPTRGSLHEALAATGSTEP